MSEKLGDKRRIAKNAAMLWLRMLLSIVVSIYTSRVVLQTLGVEDYGIYNVVGGITAMFTFLNSAMASATSRFLTYEMVQNNGIRLRDTFSSALIIHLALAFLVLLLAESIGLWFLNHKLVIPEDRQFAAHCVYQFTIISMMIGFTQVPYDASIIAHEKMNVYAYIELANVGLKLAIVYLLVIGNFDKLILYGLLATLVSFLIAIAYRTYCLCKFEETHFHWVWQPKILKPMLSFSGWNLFGNMSVSVKTQGTNFLLNMFFGPVVNAAAGIVTTIQGILIGFSFNIVTAFRPQIIKAYAKKDAIDVCQLIQLGIKFSVAFIVIVSLPIYWELDYIMQLWLGLVPPYAIDFLRIILIYIPFQTINSILNVLIQASGNIRNTNIIMGSIFSLTVVIVYICFIRGFLPSAAYMVMTIACLLVLISNCLLIKYQLNLSGITNIVMKAVLYNMVVVILISFSIRHIQYFIPESFHRLLLVSMISTFLYIVSFFYLFLNKLQQKQISIWVKTKFTSF